MWVFTCFMDWLLKLGIVVDAEEPDAMFSHHPVSSRYTQHRAVMHQVISLDCASRLMSSTYRIQAARSLGKFGHYTRQGCSRNSLMTEQRAFVGPLLFRRRIRVDSGDFHRSSNAPLWRSCFPDCGTPSMSSGGAARRYRSACKLTMGDVVQRNGRV